MGCNLYCLVQFDPDRPEFSQFGDAVKLASVHWPHKHSFCQWPKCIYLPSSAEEIRQENRSTRNFIQNTQPARSAIINWASLVYSIGAVLEALLTKYKKQTCITTTTKASKNKKSLILSAWSSWEDMLVRDPSLSKCAFVVDVGSDFAYCWLHFHGQSRWRCCWYWNNTTNRMNRDLLSSLIGYTVQLVRRRSYQMNGVNKLIIIFSRFCVYGSFISGASFCVVLDSICRKWNLGFPVSNSLFFGTTW